MLNRYLGMTLISMSLCACHPGSTPTANSADGAQGIVGGRLAQPEEPGFSSTVKITSNGIEGSSDCTGTLIGPRLVLTAAHCLPDDLRELPAFHNPKFLLGTVKFAAGGETRKIQDFVVHEGYISGDINFPKIGDYYFPVSIDDIALVLLDSDAPAKAKIADYRKSIVTVGSAVDVVVMGYGATDGKKKDKPISLRRASMRGWIKPEFKDKIYFDQSAGKGMCYGDSGGPIYYMNKSNQPELVGVISQLTGPFVKQPDGDYVPAVKTDDPCMYRAFAVEIGNFLPWIDRNSEILLGHKCNMQSFFAYAAVYAGIQAGYSDLDGSENTVISDPVFRPPYIDWSVSAIGIRGQAINFKVTSLYTCQVVSAEKVQK